MSKVRICDRCGAVVKKKLAFKFKHYAWSSSLPWEFHLCKRCTDELDSWFKNKDAEEGMED